MNRIDEFLNNLGLSDKEISVYLCSLRVGTQPASVISKKLSLPRSTVKFVFEQLLERGFVTKVLKDKVVYYTAVNPENLEYFLLDKVAHFKRLIADFKHVAPLMDSLKRANTLSPLVQYYEGYEGLCRMLDDFAAIDQTVLYISGHNMMHPDIRKYVYDVYLPICDKHKHKNKIILNDGAKAREYQKKAKNSYDEFVFVKSKDFPLTLTTAIYGDKVAFWSYDPDDMTGVIIQNRLIAEHMRTIFGVMKKYFLDPCQNSL